MTHCDERIKLALASARDTREVLIGPRAIARAAEVFAAHFRRQPALIVADVNTSDVAGRRVLEILRGAGHVCAEPFIFENPQLAAKYDAVTALQSHLQDQQTIAVAVGSGTINDITKLASHHVGRPYMCVATAASMDGYASNGASITRDGSKETFACPAPRLVLADLEIIRAAPCELSAAGYADLLAKVTAGADWILADALGVEPLHSVAWHLVQDHLRESLIDAAGVRDASAVAIKQLVAGLIMCGLAMQAAESSRPASGAEHQFSHLWDMQHHTHNGRMPLHGFKVGIATLAVAGLYEGLLARDLEHLNVDDCCARWPDESQLESRIDSLFDLPEIRAKALEEARAKYLDRAALRAQLILLKATWPSLRLRLSAQLWPVAPLRQMLSAAGAPVDPEEIGISPERLRRSFRQATHLRRRYTVLDLALALGMI